MPKELQTRKRFPFVRFGEIGQTIIGMVEEVVSLPGKPTSDGGNGQTNDFFVLSNAMFRDKNDKHWMASDGLSVNISAGIREKLRTNLRTHKDEYLSFRFMGEEPAKRGNKKKAFRVVAYTSQEFMEIYNSAHDGRERVDAEKGPFYDHALDDEQFNLADAASKPAPRSAAAAADGTTDDDEDLPF